MQGSTVTRRGLVTGALSLALVGCAQQADRDEAPSEAPKAADALSPTPTPSSTPAPQAVGPDVEAIIAAHEPLVPAHWGVSIPGVAHTGAEAGSAQPAAVHLTLDACGGPTGSGYDAALIDGLVSFGVAATLFLNQRWIATNPEIAAALAANPLFSIQNHGSQHRPLSVTGAAAYGIPGTTNAREAAFEVWDNHQSITQLTGTPPRWFRPGTAHLDDVGLSIAGGFGERIAGFAINADGGATLPAAGVTAELMRCAGGELVIAHMNQPGSGTAAGILAAIPRLQARGISFAAL